MLLNRVFYFAVLLFSVLFLAFGSRLMETDIRALSARTVRPYFSGVVTQIVDRDETIIGDSGMVDTTVIFDVRLTGGGRRGDVVTARQHLSEFFLINEREVTTGDRVLLIYFESTSAYRFVNYIRLHYIIILGAVAASSARGVEITGSMISSSI